MLANGVAGLIARTKTGGQLDDETPRPEEAPHGGSKVQGGVRAGGTGICSGGASDSRPDGGKLAQAEDCPAPKHNVVGLCAIERRAGAAVAPDRAKLDAGSPIGHTASGRQHCGQGQPSVQGWSVGWSAVWATSSD